MCNQNRIWLVPVFQRDLRGWWADWRRISVKAGTKCDARRIAAEKYPRPRFKVGIPQEV